MASSAVIGRRIREARLKAGLSQRRLGILAGFDEFSASPRINQYERGRHSPEFTTVERLAKVLGVPTPFFYCRDDELAQWVASYQVLGRRQRQQILRKAKRAL
jgi:transcriptional regulator with XRE-family HTH domain